MTREKLIELVKKTKIYNLLKSIIYQTKEKDYYQSFLDGSEVNEYIKTLIENGKPFVVSRLGSTELRILKSYKTNKTYGKNDKELIKKWSGFFPIDDQNLDHFCELYYKIMPEIDLLGVSFIPYENTIANKICPNAKLTKIRNLEPYFYQNPWSKYLATKKVLVIHPFVSSIQSQFEKRAMLFKNPEVLPNFALMTYKAAQTLDGGNGEYTSWFEALEKMENDIAKIDFDIAIIGAGVYGVPLAVSIKNMGKQAIHLGGPTQMLFGIYGRRWEIHPDFKDLINQHWIRPSEDEKPVSAEKVENACYW